MIALTATAYAQSLSIGLGIHNTAIRTGSGVAAPATFILLNTGTDKILFNAGGNLKCNGC